jgi:hypothetical protein
VRSSLSMEPELRRLQSAARFFIRHLVFPIFMAAHRPAMKAAADKPWCERADWSASHGLSAFEPNN